MLVCFLIERKSGHRGTDFTKNLFDDLFSLFRQFFFNFLHNIGGFSLDLVDGRVNSGSLLDQEGTKDTSVNDLSSLELGEDQVENKGSLEGVVKGDPVKENIGKEFEYVEHSKDCPVGEPSKYTLMGLTIGCGGRRGDPMHLPRV